MDLLLLRGSLKISVQYHSRLEMSTKNVIKWADSLSRFNGTTAKFLTDKSWVIHLLISFMGNHENLLIYAQQNRNTQVRTWTILDWIDAWSMLNKIETRKYVHELFSIELTNWKIATLFSFFSISMKAASALNVDSTGDNI